MLNQTRSTQNNKTSYTSTETVVKSDLIDNNTEESEILEGVHNKENIDDQKIPIKLQSTLSTETTTMYNIQKPTIKVNNQDTEPKNYDIVTTIKNKLQFNNERVSIIFH